MTTVPDLNWGSLALAYRLKGIPSALEELNRQGYQLVPTAKVSALENALDPTKWTKEMADAWMTALPDTMKAFEALRAVAQKG